MLICLLYVMLIYLVLLVVYEIFRLLGVYYVWEQRSPAARVSRAMVDLPPDLESAPPAPQPGATMRAPPSPFVDDTTDFSVPESWAAGLRQDPNNYTGFLAFADWLDEQGNPRLSHRAAFIRVSCRLTNRVKGRPGIKDRAELNHLFSVDPEACLGRGWKVIANGRSSHEYRLLTWADNEPTDPLVVVGKPAYMHLRNGFVRHAATGNDMLNHKGLFGILGREQPLIVSAAVRCSILPDAVKVANQWVAIRPGATLVLGGCFANVSRHGAHWRAMALQEVLALIKTHGRAVGGLVGPAWLRRGLVATQTYMDWGGICHERRGSW